jgi:hypothetical protein
LKQLVLSDYLGGSFKALIEEQKADKLADN